MAERNDTSERFRKPAETWFLRAGEDTVYGEIELVTLAEWAGKGRILPNHEVSRNGRDWVKAETVPELKMDWYATLKSGTTHGPLNLLALPDLFRRGVLDPTVVLRNKLTNREVPASSILRGVPDPSTAPKQPPPLRKIQVRSGTRLPLATSADRSDDTAATIVQPSRLPGIRLRGAARAVLPVPANAATSSGARVPPPKPPAAPETSTQAPAAVTDSAQPLMEQLREAQNEVRSHKDRIAGLLKQLADETALHEQLRARHTRTVREMQSRIDKLQEELEAKTLQIAEDQQGIGDLKERCEELETKNRELSELPPRTEGLDQASAAALKEDLRKAQEAGQQFKQQAAARETELGREIDTLKKEAARRNQEVLGLKPQLARVEQDNARLNRELESLKPGFEQLRAENEQLAAGAGKLKPELARLEQDNARLNRELGALRPQVARFEEQNARLSKEIGTLQPTLEQLQGGNSRLSREAATIRDENRRLNRETDDLRRRISALLDGHAAIGAELATPGQAHAVEAAETRWFLRLEANRIFGPVSAGELFQWAADCRIGPGQQISLDRKNWRPAEALPELRMQWNVTLIDGTCYGPLNAFALTHLVRDGVASLDSPVVHNGSGEAKPLANALIAEAAALKQRETALLDEGRRHASAVAAVLRRIEEQRKSVPSPRSAAPAESAPPLTIKRRLLARNGAAATLVASGNESRKS